MSFNTIDTPQNSVKVRRVMTAPRLDPSEEPEQTIDLSKRYDVYVSEHPTGIVVFRNVKFIGRKGLFSGGNKFDTFNKFVELEQEDGTCVFANHIALNRICLHGIEVVAEVLRR